MGIKKIKQVLNNIKVGLALSLASADKVILKDDQYKAPENTNIVSQNFSRHEFVRSIQQGKFTQQQIEQYYKLLDKMDKAHGRKVIGRYEPILDEKGEPVQVKDHDGELVTLMQWIPGLIPLLNDDGTPQLDEEGNQLYKEAFYEEYDEYEANKQLIGDVVDGYRTELFLVNKDIQIKDVHMWGVHEFNGIDGKTLDDAIAEHVKWEPTLVIHREYITYGVPKIENYAHEIFVKIRNLQDWEIDKTCLVEFYCMNFDRKRMEAECRDGIFGEVNENLFEKLHMANLLDHFKNFQSFTIKELTATRNDIDHSFKITEFKEIKKQKKGFVIKFYAEKLNNNTDNQNVT